MNWEPERAVQIVAGTPSGGGLDRVARALAKAIAATGLLGVPIDVVNVAGDGARRAWTHYIDNHPGDGHVIGISSPNLTTDYLVGTASFEHSKYVPVATLVTEYIAFAVKSDSPLQTGADLFSRLGGNPSSVTVALSTALGNLNHVALAQLTRHAGGDVNAPTIRIFDTALDAVADVIEGKSDVCAVTAASMLAELNAGRLRVLGISAPERLSGAFARTPTWNEQSADCVIGAWRGVTGPTGLAPAQVAYWERILRAAVEQPVWGEELTRLNWSPMYRDGAKLRVYLDSERADFVAVLGELGLLKA
ncbi:MAG TPA: tripartite tricarboxylate transporter substrate-binding protein [Xanthobacteraceae bacterium]|jgi:putative tricarboxylic transport membrane protein|nr:tripartite tricarboxylate transporter substrate-binding protein [Xanthobacteraceae bacterium]